MDEIICIHKYILIDSITFNNMVIGGIFYCEKCLDMKKKTFLKSKRD